MATIRTAIELQDNFTGVLDSIVSAVSVAVSTMGDLSRAMSAPADTASLDAAREAASRAAIAVRELDAAMQGAGGADMGAPAPARIEWQTDSLPTFTNTGIERFRQEAQSANNMLNALSGTQQKIAEAAARTDLFPPSAASDLGAVQGRLAAIQQRVRAIEGNPLNIGSDEASAGLERLRGQLDRAAREQEELNRAVESMDVGAANQAYLRLSQTVGDTERYIRDNADEQGNFNRAISEGAERANGLAGMIRGAVAALATAQTARKALDLSDQLTSTTARLDMMNDGLQTTRELQDMIFLSAERARGSYQQTADAVSKLGLMAGDAFSSSEEIIAFTEQLNKQFTIAGTEAAGIDAAMLQLTQAMGSGVLRGEEYNSVLEQAPNIIQAIADYLDVPKGQLKDMAAEGQITAEIVKNALFAAADETNAKFEQMPKTFSQIWASFQNNATMAFQPVLQRLGEIANSGAFQSLVSSAIGALSAVASTALGIFDAVMQVGSVIADNWSWIAPIIGVATAALVGYYTALGIYNAVQLVSNGIKAAAALAESVHAASLAMEAGATFGATAAQYGLNAALLACPLTWIIALIVALTAVVIAVAHHIASLGGTATTTFGVICGGANVVIQFFKNLGLEVANVALGIWSAMQAAARNVQTSFRNAILNVQSLFYSLLSTALNVVSGICAALNKLPFVSFDYSGITAKAGEYADRAAAAKGSRGGYESVSGAFSAGSGRFDAFGSGWAADAYDAGAAWGDGVSAKAAGLFGGGGGAEAYSPEPFDYSGYGAQPALEVPALGGSAGGVPGLGGYDAGQLPGNVADIAASTARAADSLDATGEELKYLRDIAERDAVNRFTAAKISVVQNNSNSVSSGMDLDGVTSGLAAGIREAIAKATEGGHA